ncbi:MULTISPECIES: flagellar filament capping protein FliD [Pseudomonas]|jgi:flagellar hook-associated protein 2|uniref:Flagellar hook-associated protein 2 n=1 Tax=Pseudomonas putida TaxID=303 RepID=A0A7Y8CYV9_PSEPU|nr:MULTISPECIES: flagellar filament capping protein FliD [Pseudomonas]QPN45685.1 flagellar filament capping protein FliD [Priestia aryabhattai]KAF1305440.1 flagellar hook protein [Pseudomonas sp. SG-MS2]MBG6125285.1 flagellar hook-associated protein 2 [Pseudomonas sp. M2]NSX18664.1 flagellar filament capping protein FliD [Pseudomonas putida]NWC78752.1 flagellar filament capping protein FliD [Pseudomonas putida]
MTTTTSSTASITSLGVGSGLDLESILESLEESKTTSLLDPITAQEESVEAEISAYGTLTSALDTLQSAAEALADASLYESLSTSISGSGVAVTTSSEAVAGTYSIEVTQLAQAQSLATDGISDTTTTLGTGTLTLQAGSNDAVSITLDSSNNTLEGLRDAINDADAGITATIVSDGSDSPYRLVLTSDSTGTEAAMTVSYSSSDSSDLAASLFGYADGTGNMTETVAAQDAELTINGIAITSQSNTVEEALQGVTLTLSDTGSSQTLTITRDTDSIESAITAFVDAYNDFVTTVDELTAYDADAGTSGELLGDSTTRRISTELASDIYTQIGSGTFSYLSQLGIALESDGTLSIDEDTLASALEDNIDAVSEFFIGSDGSSGFITRMTEDLDNYLDEDTGLIPAKTDSLDNKLDQLEERYDEKQALIDSEMERWREQFTELDTLISTLNSTADYLTEQFEALNSD